MMSRIETLSKEIEALQDENEALENHIECLRWQSDMCEQQLYDKTLADAVAFARDVGKRLSAYLQHVKESVAGTQGRKNSPQKRRPGRRGPGYCDTE